MPEPVDKLLCARWVVPVDLTGVVHEHAAVAVRDGHIVDVLPQRAADAKYAAQERIDCPTHALLPGFVNAHTHAAMTLLRGLADDLPLTPWLEEHIWPAELKWMSPTFVRDGTELAIAEMLLGGTTCFNDMYFFPDVVARTAVAARMRACVGMIVVDFASPWADTTDDYLSKGLAVYDDYKGDPLVHAVFAPHAPYSVSGEALARVRRLSDQLEAPVHIHLHETAGEVARFQARFGCRPLERIAELGLLSPALLAVHMTQLEPAEIESLAQHGASVVHCPESNMKLASGFCPVARLLQAGVNVALGTDGAASNNNLDMLAEMRAAALIGKSVAGDPAAVNAWQALRMATLNGARALGLGDEIGSITPGKWADLISIDLRRANTQPVFDPVSQIVYAAEASQIDHVWVAGKRLVAGGELTRMQIDDVFERAAAWSQRIAPAGSPTAADQQGPA